MKRKRNRSRSKRLLSAVLATQLPLSTAAQTMAPLAVAADDVVQSAEEQALSFQEYQRTADALTVPDEPLWQKLALAAAEEDTDTAVDTSTDVPEKAAPGGGEETTAPAQGDALTEEGETEGDSLANSQPSNETDVTTDPDMGGEDLPADDDAPTSEEEAGSSDDASSIEKGDADSQTSEEPNAEDDADSQTEESSQQAADSDPEEVGLLASAVDPGEELSTFAVDVYSPVDFILLMGGYGVEYSAGVTDSSWGTAKYNIEWDGHEWTEIGNDHIKTTVFSLVGVNDAPFSVEEKSDGWYLTDPILARFGNIPRLPNKEFAGWYIHQNRSDSEKYLAEYLTDSDYEPWKGTASSTYQYEKYEERDNVGTVIENSLKTVAVKDIDDVVPFDSSKSMESYREYVVTQTDPGKVHILPVIGVWKDSSNATGTALEVTTTSTILGDGSSTAATGLRTYTTSDLQTLLDKTAADLETTPTATFSSEQENYFLRVPYTADRLSLDFTSFEPGSNVVVTLEYGDSKQTYRVDGGLTAEETTKTYDLNSKAYSTYDGSNPTNSPASDPNSRDYTATGPARKIFHLTDVPLKCYANSASTCNTISIQVTAPDGTTTKTYTLSVQRLGDPEMQADPGNTPYGMIAREPDKDDAWRKAAKDDYNNTSSPNTFTGTSFTGAINNNGFVYTKRYVATAWASGENLDKNETAIVVYENSSFQVPDVTVYDALGKPHTMADSAVSWSVTLTTVDTLAPRVCTDYYSGSTSAKTLTNADAVNGLVTLPRNVKPGVYTMTYTYSDPYDQATHNDASHGFTRYMVVLPIPGDVDLDGEVTTADGVMLNQLLEEDFFVGYAYDVTKSLYADRVCDVLNDTNHLGVDQYDAAELLSGFDSPAYGHTKESAAYYFYLPLTTPDQPSHRPAVTTATANVGSMAVFHVAYQGQGSDHTNLDSSSGLDYNPEVVTPFWMGLTLTNASGLPDTMKGSVTTFTFTLAYDSAYVAPYVPEGQIWADYILTVNSDWQGAKLETSSGVGLTPVTHHLSKSDPSIAKSSLKELRFSVTISADKAVSLSDGTLFRVPFVLKAYPSDLDSNKKAALAEAALGMRDFTITTTAGSGVWNNQPNPNNNVVTTNLAAAVAYTGTDKVPIGVNKAPGTALTLTNGKNPVYGESFTISLPKDQTNWEGSSLVESDTSKLPDGITYSKSSATISGIPTQSGSFSFIIKSGNTQYQFQIMVDKAPLNLTVQNVTMYYGQPTTNTDSVQNTTAQTFTYDTTQIKACDLQENLSNTGTEADLKALLSKANDGYSAPQISLVKTPEVDGVLISRTTVPGTYSVIIQNGGSSNYKFYYVQPAAGESGTDVASPDFGYASLTIKERPIIIEQVTKSPLGELLDSSGTTGQLANQTASYTAYEFTATSPAVDGFYGGIPLSHDSVVNGDEVAIYYTAQVNDWENAKKSPGLKDATVPDVSFQAASNENANNLYVMANPTASALEVHQNGAEAGKWKQPTITTGGQIKVKARTLYDVKLEGTWADNTVTTDRVYTYGTPLSLDVLSVRLFFLDVNDKPETEGTQLTSSNWFKSGVEDLYEKYGLTIQWVSGKDVIPAAVDPATVGTGDEYYPDIAYTGQEITVKDYDNKWLCVTLQDSDKGTGDPFRIYLGPVTVNKQVITITPLPSARYYGEAEPAFDFTYDTSVLALWDIPTSGAANTRYGLSINSMITGYQEPVISYRTEPSPTGGEAVDNGTSIGERYVVLSGAVSDNYSFQYLSTDAVGKELTTVDPSDEFGYTSLTIRPRPILVTQINAPAGSLMYDSTTNVITNATATVAPNHDDGFAVAQLTSETTYYVRADNGATAEYKLSAALTGSAIRTGDTVTVQYKATFDKDNGSPPMWNLGDKAFLNDVKVSIEDLELTTAAQSSNYQLVFASPTAAAMKHTTDTAGKQTDSTGLVTRRMIQTIRVEQAPSRMSYNYGGGDQDNGTLALNGLKVWITYNSGAPEELEWSVITVDGTETDTFAQRGLTVRWEKADGASAVQGQPLTVADHNGKQLVITGQAVAEHDVVVATLAAGVNMTITVAKRDLHLKAVDKTRAYGMENGVYEFTFDPTELASWDKEKLDALNLSDDGSTMGSATAQRTAATSAALSALDSTFVGPIFQTAADATSVAKDEPYELYLNGGTMANYYLWTSNGKITVVCRPIYLAEINKTPLYSVSQGASTSTTYSVVCYEGTKDGEEHTDVTVGIGTQTEIGKAIADAGQTAVLAGDLIALDIPFKYNTTASVTTDANYTTLSIQSGITLAQGADKYVLESSNVGTAKGAVHNQKIESISIHSVPVTSYEYGKTLSLADLVITVKYEQDGGALSTENRHVSEFDLLTAYYYDSNVIPDESQWASIPSNYEEAKTGDAMSVTKHNGKYLLILAKASGDADAGYVKPVIVPNPLSVSPRPLQYVFTAADKVYDATTKAQGTIQLKNVNAGDKVWVVNGVDYKNTAIPSDYTFASGDTGMTFTFTSPNVDPNGNAIKVNVSGLSLAGPDAANYDLGPKEVTTTTVHTVSGRGSVPEARITQAQRTAPDIVITLTVGEHSNTVQVTTDKTALSFGNTADKLNSQLHYEYRLLYLDEADGTVTGQTAFQSSPFFGGEWVASGQSALPGDTELQNRIQLPRGTYVMAEVRLCETQNYKVSDPTASVPTDERAAAIEESKNLPTVDDKTDRSRLPERKPGPVIKTYSYRYDLWDVGTLQEEGSQTSTTVVTLADVWFSDLTVFETQQDFERMVDNLETPTYTGYFWDEGQKTALTFSKELDFTNDVVVKVSVAQEDGTTAEQEVTVNPVDAHGNRSATIYVTTVPRSTSSGAITSIAIDSLDLTAKVGDEPVQLELIVKPKNASTRNLTWTSSDSGVATVSSTGLVTFVGPGVTTITVATRSGLSYSIMVTVLGGQAYEETMLNIHYDGAYMDLTDGGCFVPDDAISREDMVVVMARLFRMLDGVKPKKEATNYQDVGNQADYLDSLDLLDRWGIIVGVGDNCFDPESPTTRAEIAVVLVKMLMLPVNTDPNAPHAFIDATPDNHWGWAYVDALAAAGLTAGVGGGCYDPDAPVTRAELATFIANVLATKADTTSPELVIPIDVPETHWAYSSILRAVNSGAMVIWKETLSDPV